MYLRLHNSAAIISTTTTTAAMAKVAEMVEVVVLVLISAVVVVKIVEVVEIEEVVAYLCWPLIYSSNIGSSLAIVVAGMVAVVIVKVGLRAM